MSDRLAELRRQRALIAEHLAWLDRQIADASGTKAGEFSVAPTPPVPPDPAPLPAPVPSAEAAAVVAAALKATAATAPKSAPAEVESAAASILDEYRQSPDNLKTDVRKGCVLYFVAALALVALGVAALWFAFRK